MLFTLSPFKGKVSIQAGMLPNRKDLLALAVHQASNKEFIFALAMWPEEQDRVISTQVFRWHRRSSSSGCKRQQDRMVQHLLWEVSSQGMTQLFCFPICGGKENKFPIKKLICGEMTNTPWTASYHVLVLGMLRIAPPGCPFMHVGQMSIRKGLGTELLLSQKRRG